MSKILMEVCCGSRRCDRSWKAAPTGELNSSLFHGGLTPPSAR
jgi:hypothetical protein